MLLGVWNLVTTLIINQVIISNKSPYALWNFSKIIYKQYMFFSVLVDKANEGDVNNWEDNWDDDEEEEDFSVQLR